MPFQCDQSFILLAPSNSDKHMLMRKKVLTKIRRKMTRKPRSRVKILIYQTWPIPWGHGYYSPLQQLLGEYVQAFGATTSGIIWVDKR